MTSNRELLEGRYKIAHFCGPGGEKASLHADLPAARDTIARIRILDRNPDVHVALAHDASWMKEGKDQVLMSLLDADMRKAARERIPNDEIP